MTLVGTLEGLFFIRDGEPRGRASTPRSRRDAEVTAVAAPYFTVVGMFLIFPAMICALIF